MSEQIAPAWLRRQNDLLAVAKAAQQEQELASMTIKANGPEYWKALLKELQIIAAAVGPGLIGSFSHSNFSLSRVEDHCRLQVARCGPVHKLSYADLWYRTGDGAIRCKKSLFGEDFILQLCVVDGAVRAATEKHLEPMNIEEAGEFIAGPMIQYAIGGALISA